MTRLGVAPPLCSLPDARAGARLDRRRGAAYREAARRLAYFRSAKAALRKLHRAGICHNDLAKEQNWLRGSDGRAYLTDFQLAPGCSRRSRLFRIAAYEDLRHLLKHKRRYAPEALTAAERRVLARKSLFTRVWMATGKQVYHWVTRGLLRFTDREGGGPRLVSRRAAYRRPAQDRTRRCARSPSSPIPDRRAGTGLYAFVEARRLGRARLRDLSSPAGRRIASRPSTCRSSRRCRARAERRGSAAKSCSSSP